MHKEYKELTPDQIARFHRQYKTGGQQNMQGCWEWIGNTLTSKRLTVPDVVHPIFNYNGYKGYARLISYRLHFGHWPALSLSALCGNELCVNPHHLFPRKNSAVQLSSVQKGTARVAHQQGSLHHKTHLTEDDVRAIRRQIEQQQLGLVGKLTYNEIGECYGVKAGVIQEIAQRKTWQHVK